MVPGVLPPLPFPGQIPVSGGMHSSLSIIAPITALSVPTPSNVLQVQFVAAVPAYRNPCSPSVPLSAMSRGDWFSSSWSGRSAGRGAACPHSLDRREAPYVQTVSAVTVWWMRVKNAMTAISSIPIPARVCVRWSRSVRRMRAPPAAPRSAPCRTSSARPRPISPVSSAGAGVETAVGAEVEAAAFPPAAPEHAVLPQITARGEGQHSVP